MSNVLDRLTTALSDRYRIEREIGAGGMATVYLAEDVKHHRRVAVKVLRSDLASAIGPERFLREIETTAQLHHPHILPLYDSGEADGFLYYVMPYVEGESLRDRLEREKQLPLNDALSIAREVADALSYAHARGVVHRDIKPENILLESGHAVVADFGIARALSAVGGQRLTQTGMAIGTPQYMSPEQAAGDSDVDGRSDLYSLACVLYEMLAGQPPFTGPTVESVVRQHLIDPARPVSQLRPAVPPAISDVLARALAKNPADRFSPAAHFAAAISVAPVAAIPARRRLPSAVAGIVAATVLVAIVVIVMLARRSNNTPALAIGRTTQVTRDAGLEVDPALSPDGISVAYAAGPTNAMQVYVRQVSGGRPVALTNDTTDNFRWPRWSPDGTQIAYQSNDGIHVVPALGGSSRRVTRVDPSTLHSGVGWQTPISGFDWSPDGTQIVWAAGFGDTVLTVVALSGGKPHTLSVPGGAFSPAWSRDGTSIAFAVGNQAFTFGTGYFANAGAASIWIVRVDDSGATRLTTDSTLNVSPQWSPDGSELFWVSDRDGSRDVYVQRMRSSVTAVGTPRRVTVGADAHGVTVSGRGPDLRMAYSRLSTWSRIWSIPVPKAGPVSIRGATPITTGNELIEDVDVSADGRWLVFDSDRSGNADLYVMSTAGGEARRITTDPAGDYSGDWSPDGSRIAFHSRRSGTRDIFTVEADGTGLRQWTSAAAEELDPDWAPDGETVVFEVFGRTRGFTTLRLTEGAQPAFTAIKVGDFAHWSPDGSTFVYHSDDGLRTRRADGGTETLIVSNVIGGADAYYAAWSPDGGTIYYLARSPKGWTIRSVSADGRAHAVLVDFDDPTRQQTRYGLATDGKVFYLTIGSPESDIVVAQLERQ